MLYLPVYLPQEVLHLWRQTLLVVSFLTYISSCWYLIFVSCKGPFIFYEHWYARGFFRFETLYFIFPLTSLLGWKEEPIDDISASIARNSSSLIKINNSSFLYLGQNVFKLRMILISYQLLVCTQRGDLKLQILLLTRRKGEWIFCISLKFDENPRYSRFTSHYLLAVERLYFRPGTTIMYVSSLYVEFICLRARVVTRNGHHDSQNT